VNCHVCGRGAGAACRFCGRGVCTKHGTSDRRGFWICNFADSVCGGVKSTITTSSRVRAVVMSAPYGTCPYCGTQLVKENDSPPYVTPECPIHGYVEAIRTPP